MHASITRVLKRTNFRTMIDEKTIFEIADSKKPGIWRSTHLLEHNALASVHQFIGVIHAKTYAALSKPSGVRCESSAVEQEFIGSCSGPLYRGSFLHEQRGAHRPREDRDRAPFWPWGRDSRRRSGRPSTSHWCVFMPTIGACNAIRNAAAG